MPRVLQVINRLSIGGPTLNVVYLATLLDEDFETKIVSGHIESHEQTSEHILVEYNLEAEYLDTMFRSISLYQDFRAFQDLRKVIKDFRPDIVHTHAAKAGAIGRIAARLEKVPVIIHTFHGHVFHSYFGKLKSSVFIMLERWLAKISTKLIAISDLQKEELVNTYRISREEKFVTIPLGVDLKKFENIEKKFSISQREKLGIKTDEIIISIIGRLVPIKNHELFLEAFALAAENSKESIKAIIVGDGETKDRLISKCSELGLSFCQGSKFENNSQVLFTSWISRMEEILAVTDIVALSSRNEGTPVSLIEASASGLPVVATDVGGVRDVVLNEKSALVVSVLNAENFAEKLRKLIENSELRVELGANGKSFVMNKFSLHRLTTNMNTLYRDLLDA